MSGRRAGCRRAILSGNRPCPARTRERTSRFSGQRAILTNRPACCAARSSQLHGLTGVRAELVRNSPVSGLCAANRTSRFSGQLSSGALDGEPGKKCEESSESPSRQNRRLGFANLVEARREYFAACLGGRTPNVSRVLTDIPCRTKTACALGDLAALWEHRRDGNGATVELRCGIARAHAGRSG